MRAAVVTRHGSPEEALDVVEMDTPAPGPGEARIRVEACALNHFDVFARTGHPSHEPSFPVVTGGDVAGVVDSTGAGVDGWSAGDRVVVYPEIGCGDCEWCERGEQTMCRDGSAVGEDRRGGLAEYLVVPADLLEPLPDHLDWATAAAWPIAYTTAWRMVVTAGELRPAETALVLGASGGVGNAALQVADRLGATVYATTSSDEKAAWLSRWAEAVVDYTSGPFADRVRGLTDGRGVDLVADHVGAETWQSSVDCLAPGGRMVVCGATSGPNPDLDIRSVYQPHRRILGAPMGNRREFRDVGRLVAAGDLEPQVHRELPLDDVAEAHRLLEDRGVQGKVVVRPWE